MGTVLKLFSCYVSSALNTVHVKHSGPLKWSSRSISIITPPTPTPHLGCNQILLTHTLTQDRRYWARFSYKFPMREHQTPPVVWQSSLLFPHPLLCPNAPALILSILAFSISPSRLNVNFYPKSPSEMDICVIKQVFWGLKVNH